MDTSSTHIVDVLYLMVFANFKMDNYEDAIDLLKQIIEHKPDLEYLNGLGECMIKVKKYDEFVQYIEHFTETQQKSIKSMHLDIIMYIFQASFESI